MARRARARVIINLAGAHGGNLTGGDPERHPLPSSGIDLSNAPGYLHQLLGSDEATEAIALREVDAEA